MLKLLVLIPILLIILFLRFCLVSIKKQWIDKQPISSGDQVVGLNILKQFQNSEKQSAIEHVVYMEEDEQEESDNGLLDENMKS